MMHKVRGRHRYTHKGYVLVYYPEHPHSWKNGLVYLHRLHLENHLGRYLGQEEYVHHKDGNKKNNRLSNLEVTTNREHVSCHKRYLKDRTCLFCGKVYRPLRGRQKYCSSSCSSRSSRRAERPDKETLKELVWSEPTSRVSAKFGVTDKAVEKWCKAYGIEKPPRGYWRKNGY